MITYSTYMKKTNSDGTYQNLYFSTLTEPDLYASYNGGNSWLNTYSQIIGDNQNGKYLMCNGYGDYNILEIFKNSSNATFRNGSTFNNKKVSLYGGNYIPVLTLKNKTKLIKNDFCDSSILGTKECPYKLECNEC